jgi:hypothetical protein
VLHEAAQPDCLLMAQAAATTRAVVNEAMRMVVLGRFMSSLCSRPAS